MPDLETLNLALSAIYDTALLTETWPALLGQFCRLFGCHFADSFQRKTDHSAWRGRQFGLDERDYQDVFLGYWVKNNVWGKRRPVRQAGDIVTTREMMGRQDLERSDMYSEYLRPRQLQEGLRLDIWADADGIEDISLLRSWSAGPFTADELRAAALLMPHLQRASAVRRRLAAAEDLAHAGLAALDQVPMGVLLLDARGRVAYANRAAETLLAAGDPVSTAPDGLLARTAAGTRTLRRLIHEATGTDGRTPRSGSVRLPRASGGPAVLAVTMPIRPGPQAPFDSAGPGTFLCLIDRDRHRTPTPKHLVQLFGLTPSEATLASDLLSGSQLQDIALRTGRSVHTVRSLLGRIMAKTETSRQAELVRLLAMLPHQ